MFYRVPHYINGLKQIGENAQFLPIYNPALGEKIGEVNIASVNKCQETISTAKNAFLEWSQTPAIRRARILFKFRDLLETYQNDLAEIVTREHGKTLEDAKGSVARAIEVVEFNCGIISQLQGDYSNNVAKQIDCFTFRQPLGVCAGVSPFNFPVMVPVWMMVPAIAAGNTFILKPSEQDPSAPIRLLELLNEAGLPNGVANCLQGNKDTVNYLLANPDISAFTAVASTPVAEHIYVTATANGKRAHTFGGAKNHCVVMPDANLEQAANAIVSAAYGSAGERCMALSVVVTTNDETADSLIKTMVPKIQKIKIDSGNAEQVDMGPLISSVHRERVLAAINEGIKEGANLLLDGRTFKHEKYPNGFFLGPTLFDNVTENMSIYQNEVFGPVLVIVRAKNFEEAINLVNKHQYGNGTAIFTSDGYSAREYVERVQVGMVGINIPIPVPIANHPFGGWKRSAFGDSNMHGLESIHFYTKLKTVTSRWPSHNVVTHAFAMPTN